MIRKCLQKDYVIENLGKTIVEEVIGAVVFIVIDNAAIMHHL